MIVFGKYKRKIRWVRSLPGSTARASARSASGARPANIPWILRASAYAVQVEPDNAPRVVTSVGNLTEV